MRAFNAFGSAAVVVWDQLRQDLVLTAMNDALAKSKELAGEKLGGVTGGLKLPGF